MNLLVQILLISFNMVFVMSETSTIYYNDNKDHEHLPYNDFSSLEQSLAKLTNFLKSDPFNPDKMKTFVPRTNYTQLNRAECQKLLTRDSVPDNSTNTTTESTEPQTGPLFGAIQLLNNLGNFGTGFWDRPAQLFCYIRAPLNVVTGLLDQLIVQIKEIVGPEDSVPKQDINGGGPSGDRGAPKECDCTQFNDNVSLNVQVVRVLESVVLTLRHIISMVNILLVTPADGMCKDNLDDFAKGIGKLLGEFRPLQIVG